MTSTPTPVDLEALEALLSKATPGPWDFCSGDDQNGDPCDLLMAEIGIAQGDEEPEYAEVLFGDEFGDAERSANWELVRALRNQAPALIAELRAAREENARLRAALEAAATFIEEELQHRRDSFMPTPTEDELDCIDEAMEALVATRAALAPPAPESTKGADHAE